MHEQVPKPPAAPTDQTAPASHTGAPPAFKKLDYTFVAAQLEQSAIRTNERIAEAEAAKAISQAILNREVSI